MANLPPRPETPPRLRDDRRHPPDERDRVQRSAQPMAPRFRPSERIPERDRSYVPRKPDTYIPGGYDSRRDVERREYDERDREQDRYRDFDRDKERRNGARERDYDRSRSPRRRSPDRDRRPYDRDRPYRRPPSTPRRSGPSFGRRHSRSPPRWRRRSPSPYRSRHRSRSPSPRTSASASKATRLGNHSIASPRSRSPYKRSGSRGRSSSPNKCLPASVIFPSSERQSNDKSSTCILEPVKAEEVVLERIEENPPVKIEKKSFEKPAETSPVDGNPSQEQPEIRLMNANSRLKLVSAPFQSKEELEETKIEKPGLSIYLPVQMKKVEDVDDKKMDVDTSPKAVPSAPAHGATVPGVKMRSPSPKSTPATNDHQRVAPNVLQRNWPGRSPPRAPRSPPRAPRNHRPMATPQTQTPVYPNGPRESRRPHPLAAFSDVRLPNIPIYTPPKFLLELDQELLKHETHRRTYASQHLQEVKGLQKALHELDMVSIDLHAAEGRHRIANIQLEKAKTGSLGIDAQDIIEV